MKEGYKKTELGLIPEEWDVVGIESILINEKSAIKIGPFGSQLKKEFLTDHGYKVYGQENVFANNFNIGNRYINEERYEKLKSSSLVSGDFVISMMGTVGKTAIVPENIHEGIMDSHLIRLRVDNKIYNKKLLKQLIQNSELIKGQIKRLSVGGIMEGLSSTIIKQLKLPLPLLEEQQKIADILEAVDLQIDDTDKLIEKTKELKKGLMQRLLTKGIGHSEFKKSEVGEIPIEWEVSRLKEVVEICYGKSQKEVEVENGKYKILGTGGIIGYTNEYLWNKPSVLIGRKGTIDRPQYIEEPFWTVDTLFYTKIKNDNNAKWLFYYISNLDLKKYNEATGVPSLSISNLNNIYISIPAIEEQQQIADILSSVDTQISEYENKKLKLEELKKGLMQQLLTGKIRVV